MNIQSNKPNITRQQKEILSQLYKFRFLNRLQIQTILNHKSHSRISQWLTDLTQNDYIIRYFDKTFAAKPAVYSLGNNGRKYLLKTGKSQLLQLNRVWREKNNSEEFRINCGVITDLYISLTRRASTSKSILQFLTKTELYGMQHMILDYPDAYFSISEPQDVIKRYFLDILSDVRPSILRKRIRQYLSYYDASYWQEHTSKPFPEIILICPTKKIKSHLYYYIREKLERYPAISFYLTTSELIQEKGLRRDVLQKVDISS